MFNDPENARGGSTCEATGCGEFVSIPLFRQRELLRNCNRHCRGPLRNTILVDVSSTPENIPSVVTHVSEQGRQVTVING